MRIIIPKMLCGIDFTYGPFFFLAGPVAGGGDWQRKCCEMLKSKIANFYAAIPCRYDNGHPLSAYKAAGIENYFDKQLTWERHYMAKAANTGCLLFWLPSESKTEPRTDRNPYAMDTRGEIGEWRARLAQEPALQIAIGAEANFPGLSQIQRNFNLALGYKFPIYKTLEETASVAIQRASPPKSRP